MKVYKGTDKDIRCKGYQFTPGVEAVEEEAKLCEKGFHACEAPLDVLQYYAPGDGSRYFEAELEEVSEERHSDDTKVCGKRITLGAEIGIPGLVKAHVEYVKAHTTVEHTDPNQATAGNRGAATAGEYGAATAGEYGAATAGYSGAATAGNFGAATAGDSGAATAGYGGAATSRGVCSVGKDGCCLVRGNEVKARGGLGAVIVICVEERTNYNIKEWKAGIIDGEILKPNVWYTLANGQFVEVPET